MSGHPFYLNSDEIAQIEVRNGLQQFDLGCRIIESFLSGRPFNLTPSIIRDLQAVAVDGIQPNPGEFRSGSVRIEQSKHTPPGPHLVSSLVVEMCEYINNNWHENTAFHLAAYAMWRHNWIHPFDDGNGRTSRIVSYIVLNVKIGYLVPGTPTIPEQIQNDRNKYFSALEAADERFRNGDVDVSDMEILLRDMLSRQLVGILQDAGADI